MVFGEIVEPTTRALLYEEDEYIPPENINWIEKPATPSIISSILISESAFTNEIIDACLLIPGQLAVASTRSGCISIYKYAETQFIFKCSLKSTTSIGNIMEEIRDWLDAATVIYTLITLPTASYQNKTFDLCSDMILRRLSINETNVNANWKALEAPNLITGVGANCLSYCIATDKKCSLFVAYLDYAPLDSVNSQPFIELLNHLGFDTKGHTCKLNPKLPEHNLYI